MCWLYRPMACIKFQRCYYICLNIIINNEVMVRTKLKQTELDREWLKKQCQNLSDENKRLKKELLELRALKVGPSPLCIQLSKTATLTMCSSCEKLVKLNEEKNNIELEGRNWCILEYDEAAVAIHNLKAF